ncbi:hypothetical protein BH23CHL2_BH23CHL2_06420 [soil metagenome]
MNADTSGSPVQTLEEAREIIARQNEEIDGLRQQLADSDLAEELRSAFGLAATVNVLASPVAHVRLLEMIVNTAARVIGARAAALFLIDHEASELIFEVATGSKAEEVKQFRVPLGEGIAGLVAVTAQPMAISNADQDPRHATHIAESVGYMPQSILCVPLIHDGEVIGVFELLDREDGASFSPADIELLDQFAGQAAVAIEQSRTFRNLVPMIGRTLLELGLLPREQQGPLRDRVEAFTQSVEEAQSFAQTLELARLVQGIASGGDAEYRLCRQILENVSDYLRRQRVWSDSFGANL